MIPARLAGARRRAGGGGARIEATLIARAATGLWRALARPGKRLAVGDRIDFGGALAAEVRRKDGGEVLLAFDRDGAALEAALEAVGRDAAAALHRGAAAGGRRATARTTRRSSPPGPGAVAAPTASLHFDEALLAELAARGVGRTLR